MKVDSNKDIQVYTIHHQSLGYHPPAPIRYENFYLEGKCRGKLNMNAAYLIHIVYIRGTLWWIIRILCY